MNNKKNAYIKSLALLIFSLEFIALILQFIRAYSSGHMAVSLLILLIYFTNQSNILVTIATLLIYLNIQRKFSDIFIFIAFANIIITGLIYHIFLARYFEQITFLQHILHTFIPILFTALYLLFIDTKLKIIQGLYALIYPILYFGFVYIIVHPLLGDLIGRYYPNEPDMLYVYPFLNPQHYDNGFLGVLSLILLILVPFFSLLFMGLLKTKYIIHQQIWQEKNA